MSVKPANFQEATNEVNTLMGRIDEYMAKGSDNWSAEESGTFRELYTALTEASAHLDVFQKAKADEKGRERI